MVSYFRFYVKTKFSQTACHKCWKADKFAIEIPNTIVPNWHLYSLLLLNRSVLCELMQNVLQKVAEEVDDLIQMAVGEGSEKIQASTCIMIIVHCSGQPYLKS